MLRNEHMKCCIPEILVKPNNEIEIRREHDNVQVWVDHTDKHVSNISFRKPSGDHPRVHAGEEHCLGLSIRSTCLVKILLKSLFSLWSTYKSAKQEIHFIVWISTLPQDDPWLVEIVLPFLLCGIFDISSLPWVSYPCFSFPTLTLSIQCFYKHDASWYIATIATGAHAYGQKHIARGGGRYHMTYRDKVVSTNRGIARDLSNEIDESNFQKIIAIGIFQIISS